ncbi:MAG TPA: hypothetical protein VF533_19605 [Solirubrobacteraceae bacterium]|jgi:hypothetical protein
MRPLAAAVALVLALPAAAAAAAAALMLAAPAARADSRITVEDGGTLRLFSEDAGVANALDVGLDDRGRIRLADDGDPFGIRFPSPPCDPGKINAQANVVEVFCVRGSVRRLEVEVGAGEDRVDDRLGDTPARLDGGLGADTLRSGAADDTLIGGQGADQLDSGPGDDVVHAADGVADAVDCGDGDGDLAIVDQFDDPADCEDVAVRQVDPGAAPPVDDGVAPQLSVRAHRKQKGRRVRLKARASEDAIVQVSGYLAAGGINSRIRGRTADAGAGQDRRITLTLSHAQARRVARDLRRGRHPAVRLTVSAVDAAGHTSRARHLRIRLRR